MLHLVKAKIGKFSYLPNNLVHNIYLIIDNF